MNIEDFFKKFNEWRRLIDIDHKLREIERYRQFMSPAIDQISKLVEVRNRPLIESAVAQIAKLVEEQGKILGPAVSLLANQFEQQRQLLTPAIGEITAKLSRQRQLTEPIADQFTITKDLLHIYGDWARQLEREAGRIARFQTDFDQLVHSSAVPTIGYIASHFGRSVLDLEQFATFKRSFASEILDQIDRIQTAAGVTDIEKALSDLSELLREKAEETPRKNLSIVGLIQILLAILLFVWAQSSALKMEERIMNKIADTERNFVAQLEKFLPAAETLPRYVVTKTVRLRGGPSKEHRTLEILRPNMVVEVKESSGSWFRVEYFDYVEGTVKEGWVFNRYLKRLENG